MAHQINRASELDETHDHAHLQFHYEVDTAGRYIAVWTEELQEEDEEPVTLRLGGHP